MQVQQSLSILQIYRCDVHGGLHPGSGRPAWREHPLRLLHWGMCSRWLQLSLQQGPSLFNLTSHQWNFARMPRPAPKTLHLIAFQIQKYEKINQVFFILFLFYYFLSTRGKHLTFLKWFHFAWPRIWCMPWGQWALRASSVKPVRSPWG